MRYHVFIEGARDPSPAALTRVAAAIAARYGLSADDVARRMSAGRFRVKSDIDQPTAEALIRDLSSLGAACLLVDQDGRVVAGGMAPAPASGVPEYREYEESQKSGAAVITDRKPVRIEAAPRASQPGLPQPGAGYLNPAMGMGTAAYPGPAVPSHPPAAPAGQGWQTAPPDAPTEVPGHAVGSGVTLGATPLDRVRARLADNPRMRFAAGVFLVLCLGFLPALVFAQIRAGSYSDIDDDLRAEQAAAGELDAWNRLDELRASMLERKRSQRTSIALGGLAIWAVCSASLAFVWFRRLDWDFYRTHGPPRPLDDGPVPA